MKSIKLFVFFILTINYLITAFTLQGCKKDNSDSDNECDTCVVAYKPNVYLYPIEKTRLNVNLNFPKG